MPSLHSLGMYDFFSQERGPVALFLESWEEGVHQKVWKNVENPL